MTNRICCPFDRPNVIGGVSLAGTASIDVLNDVWDSATCILPLNEVGAGAVGEFKDRSRNHFDGTAGRKLAEDEVMDETLNPSLDVGVFCQPSQHFRGRESIWIEKDNLGQNQDFTVSLWAKIESFYQTKTYYSRGFAGPDGSQYVISLGNSFLNTLLVQVNVISSNSTITEVLKFGSGTLNQDEWYHCAITYTNSTITLYVDGVAVGTQAIDGSLLPLENECFLGCLSYSQNIVGNLQDLHVFAEAKSPAYIKAESDSYCSAFVIVGEEVPLVYW